MTQEEKAKAYDEALKRAKAILKVTDNMRESLLYVSTIFPELKDDGEKIRKEIISALKYANHKGVYDKHITWLEKQGEKKSAESSNIKSVLLVHDEILNNILERYKTSTIFKTLIVNLQNWWNNTRRHLLSFNVEQKPIIDGILTATNYDKMFQNCNGQKPVNYTDEDIVEAVKDASILDMVEPKFKVGDWIVSKTSNLVYRVDSILFPQSKCYYLSHNGGIVLVNFADEQNYRLWTIQDAKDGDVLYSPTHRLIWVYKDKDKYYAATNLNYIEAISFDGDIVIPSDVCPANRVQRSILLQKMEESGYMWDEEMKELKKVEQKLNLNEDEKLTDDCNFQYITDMIERYSKYCWNDEFSNNILNWFKSLKKRIK